MRKLSLGLATAALLGAGGLAATTASAAPISGAGGIIRDVQTSTIDKVGYYYGGRNYCWYYDGWHGPGWYWCGYSWRRGLGWGSPVWGWNNWAWSGPRYRGGGPGPGRRPGPRPGPGRGPGGHGGPGPHH